MLLLRIAEYPFDICRKLWQVVMNHLLREVQIDAKALVYEYIAGTGNLAPRHLWVSITDFSWQTLYCLADDLEASYYSVLLLRVSRELLQ